MPNKSNEKLKETIKTLNIIAICLLVVQVLGYITRGSTSDINAPSHSIAYYIGYNLWLIIAIILFIRASSLSNKIKDDENVEP